MSFSWQWITVQLIATHLITRHIFEFIQITTIKTKATMFVKTKFYDYLKHFGPECTYTKKNFKNSWTVIAKMNASAGVG